MHVLVVGGGVIGMAIAYEARRQGWSVTLVERNQCGQATSRAAAGMLVPVVEAQFGEEEMYRLNAASLARYPEWVDRLERETCIPLHFRTMGTLVVARDPDEWSYVKHFFELYHRLDPTVQLLTPREAHRLEPALSLHIAGALYSPGDHQIDNWQLIRALRTALGRAGVRVLEDTPVERIVLADGRCTGVETARGPLQADVYALAAGPWSHSIPDVRDALPLPLRPVKGQVLILKPTATAPMPERVVRGFQAYLVPKPDRLVLGATQEEVGFDPYPTAGGVYTLLEGAYEMVPGIYDMVLADILVGFRPTTPDHKPVLGPTPVENLVVATGHFRHGILLAPITAELIVEYLRTGQVPPALRPFLYERFREGPTAPGP